MAQRRTQSESTLKGEDVKRSIKQMERRKEGRNEESEFTT